MYADRGIATFPVDATKKKPLVRRPHLFGVKASRELAADPNFADASIAIWCGPRSGLTIVDVDESGDEALNRALQQFGDTPILVRTASGKYHLYYRHNGECRMIRPDRALALDVLGSGGFVIAPPSQNERGSYEFIKGGFDDLKCRRSLPTINPEALSLLRRAPEASPRKQPQLETGTVLSGRDDGKRNMLLFDFCCSRAWNVESPEELEALALAKNTQLDPPLSDEDLRDGELRRIVQSVWSYRQAGRLFRPGGEPTIPLTRSQFDVLRVDRLALALYIDLWFSHAAQPGKVFAAAVEPLRARYHVHPNRITRALNLLETLGFLKRLYKGGRGSHDASLYSLTLKRPRIAGAVGCS